MYISLFIMLIIGFIYLGTKNYEVKITDAEIFTSEFPSVDNKNVFVYSTSKEVLENINKKDCVILFGSVENSFTEKYADMINSLALENKIKEVLYYDFLDDRDHNNGNYELIVEKLKPYLLTNDRGNNELYAPTLLVMKDSEVMYINQDVNFVYGNVTPEKYWTDYNVGAFNNTIDTVFKDYLGE